MHGHCEWSYGGLHMTVTPLLSRAEGVAAVMRVTHACTEVRARNKIFIFTWNSDSVVAPLSPMSHQADPIVSVAEVPEPVILAAVVLGIRRPSRPGR